MCIQKFSRLSFLVLITVFLLPAPTIAQTDWVTYFFDDFEDGNADGWDLDPGWHVEDDNGNLVLHGSDTFQYAKIGDYNWRNYSLKLRVKLLEQTFNINFRQYSGNCYYIIIMHQDHMG